MANSYLPLGTLKGTGALNFTGTAYDSRLLALCEAVSREVDAYSNRQFFIIVETRTFNGDNAKELLVPDLVTVGTLKEDTNADGTFETGWATADYILYPYNAAPTSHWGKPYTRILVNPNSNGTQDHFLKGVQNYQIQGTWGYRRYLRDTGETGSGTLNSTATSFVLQATTTLDVGMTLALESEFVYVTATSTTSVTIERAVNGSTAAAHSTVTVNELMPLQEVREAVLIQAARLLKRRESGFASEIGLPETGQMVVWRGGLDSDVKMLLAKYRRWTP